MADGTTMAARMTRLETRLDSMGLSLHVLRADASVLKTDVSVLKADVSVLKADVSGLKRDVGELKARVEGVSQEVQQLGGACVEVRREILDHGRVVRKTMLLPDGRQFEERVRLFSLGELQAMIEHHGARVLAGFGDYDGAPAGAGSRAILLAQVSP